MCACVRECACMHADAHLETSFSCVYVCVCVRVCVRVLVRTIAIHKTCYLRLVRAIIDHCNPLMDDPL